MAPVGRLDQDTSGLLILTNDNDFADRITDPEHKVPKTYMVKTSSILSDDAIEQLRNGVDLSDGRRVLPSVRRLRDSASSTFLEITITEGRNRQVRTDDRSRRQPRPQARPNCDRRGGDRRPTNRQSPPDDVSRVESSRCPAGSKAVLQDPNH